VLSLCVMNQYAWSCSVGHSGKSVSQYVESTQFVRVPDTSSVLMSSSSGYFLLYIFLLSLTEECYSFPVSLLPDSSAHGLWWVLINVPLSSRHCGPTWSLCDTTPSSGSVFRGRRSLSLYEPKGNKYIVSIWRNILVILELLLHGFIFSS
jgi:hypothetical protein